MYSGTILRQGSGRVVGVHQKIDRVARKYVRSLLPKAYFPTSREIIHFEGVNGPDGLKRKSPGRDEPWHYIDPTDPIDIDLYAMIEDHSFNLTKALKDKDQVRASFEAAWLAHAIVDGLTPAHHFPLEEKLEELRGGEGLETRITIKEKLVMPGENRRDRLRNNWEFWGAKGVMTTHGLFEWGIASTMAPMRFKLYRPNSNELVRVRSEGIVPLFKEAMHEIYALKMYDTFHKKGWNQKLAKQTRDHLAPVIIKVVTLAWYEAVVKAGLK